MARHMLGSTRGRAMAATMLVAILTSGLAPATAGQTPPQITDIAGDANGLNAVGVELDTRPASYDPLDLVEAGLRTTYVSIPVGEDGIRHEPTGIEVRFKTTAVPSVPDSDVAFVVRLAQTIGVYETHLEAALFRDDETGEVRLPLLHVDRPCEGGTFFCWMRSRAGWSAVIDPAARQLVLTYPFNTMAGDELSLLGVGSVLRSPHAETAGPFVYAECCGIGDDTKVETGALLDGTATAPDFMIGSDVPPDVPCTKGCP